MEMNEERKGFETLLPQNRVENFNPNDVLTLVEDVDENGQPAEFLYMEFAASSRWFCCSTGIFTHKFISRD